MHSNTLSLALIAAAVCLLSGTEAKWKRNEALPGPPTVFQRDTTGLETNNNAVLLYFLNSPDLQNKPYALFTLSGDVRERMFLPNNLHGVMSTESNGISSFVLILDRPGKQAFNTESDQVVVSVSSHQPRCANVYVNHQVPGVQGPDNFDFCPGDKAYRLLDPSK